jgi:hypothetical protein
MWKTRCVKNFMYNYPSDEHSNFVAFNPGFISRILGVNRLFASSFYRKIFFDWKRAFRARILGGNPLLSGTFLGCVLDLIFALNFDTCFGLEMHPVFALAWIALPHRGCEQAMPSPRAGLANEPEDHWNDVKQVQSHDPAEPSTWPRYSQSLRSRGPASTTPVKRRAIHVAKVLAIATIPRTCEHDPGEETSSKRRRAGDLTPEPIHGEHECRKMIQIGNDPKRARTIQTPAKIYHDPCSPFPLFLDDFHPGTCFSGLVTRTLATRSTTGPKIFQPSAWDLVYTNPGLYSSRMSTWKLKLSALHMYIKIKNFIHM